MCRYKLIDLFAGAGGLSLGFKQTGHFDIKAFIEKNPHAVETYRHNFRNADWYEDVNELDFKHLNEKYGGIDVVIGGPPCQGFSNANRQHNQAINLNNKLVKQYVRAVLEIQPKAFVIENVSMLKSDVHRFFIERNDKETIAKCKIKTKVDSIFLLNKEYVFEGAEELVSDLKQIKRNQWDGMLYLLLNIWLKGSANDEKFEKVIDRHEKKIKQLIEKHEPSENLDINDADAELFRFISHAKNLKIEKEKLADLLKKPIAFQKMLQHAEEIHDNNINAEFTCIDENENQISLTAKVKSCAVYDYLTGILEAGENGYSINKGILSAEEFGVPQKRKRFVLIGVKKKYAEKVDLPKQPKDAVKTNVYDAIHDLEAADPYESVQEDSGCYLGVEANQPGVKLGFLRDNNNMVYNHIVPHTSHEALERFKRIKPGQNFHNLPDEFKTNTYTNAERTQNTIYKRLEYDKPSGTVVNVRKSMWIHPSQNRAVSVREAARLQTFPDSFRFYGPKDSEYQQVGNAVPPMLAKTIAEQILKYIGRKNGRQPYEGTAASEHVTHQEQ